jgi:photosystem II stability/assembly factor-like uncharacterized protein
MKNARSFMKSFAQVGAILGLLMGCLTLPAISHGKGGQQSQTPGAARGDAQPLGDLRFRNLGPAVAGGRVAAVAGVPGNPNIIYVGAAGGGVWKTTDGGITWRAISENFPTASIGAIALAPQNPNWVWVGTGEGNPRNDVLTGYGVYFSPDGGASWKPMGLESTGQIPVVQVSPADSNTVYVASIGHAWAPNSDRGVFRTIDGGKSWQKVLYINDTTGASDLVIDPQNPKILYAGMWQVTRHPWILESGGASSGIYRSTDGGDTWQKLTSGLPAGLMGRIGLAIAPGNPAHIYALIESKNGVLFESRDGGNRWAKVSDDRSIQARPFYFSHLYVPQDNEDRIYFLSYDILLSTDGGKNSHIIARGVHPDHHSLWIDPRDPAHLIEGNDGGIYVSFDAAEHWRYLDNLPIEQFYSVAIDDRVPYTICGGLQDNNGWCGPSNSLKAGGIGPNDWQVFVGGDGQYVVPGRGGSPYIYADSQGGNMVRTNRENEASAFVRPYNLGQFDLEVSKLKYRFNWTAPIAVSPKDSNEVYIGGNVLFRSKDAGAHWTAVSGDLTRDDKSKQVLTGGPIILDLSSAENYDTILSISISPLDTNVIWVGTDDGCVQVTRDGGAHWTNVASAVPNLPEWGRISQIDASPFAAGTAYAAVDFHQLDNNKPFVFKTEDFGKTWTAITRNLPDGVPAHVVREDPNKRGLVVVGTDTGLFYSDGDTDWKPLRNGFPVASVFDLQFAAKSHDLIVATHGRGIFVLDDISPLEQMSAAVSATNAAFHLFPIADAVRWRAGRGGGFSMGAFTAPNPPNGVVITFFVSRTPEQVERREPVFVYIYDTEGHLIRTMDSRPHNGINRVVWPLNYNGAKPLDFTSAGESSGSEEGSGGGGGRGGGPPAVAPGTYRIDLTDIAIQKTLTQNVRVEPDPRMKTDPAGFAAQVKAALEARDTQSELNTLVNHMEMIRAQLHALGVRSKSEVAIRASALEQKISAMEEPLYNPASLRDSKVYLHYLSRVSDRLVRVAGQISAGYGEPPSQIVLDELAELSAEVRRRAAEFDHFLATDAVAFNKFAAEQGVQALALGKPPAPK